MKFISIIESHPKNIQVQLVIVFVHTNLTIFVGFKLWEFITLFCFVSSIQISFGFVNECPSPKIFCVPIWETFKVIKELFDIIIFSKFNLKNNAMNEVKNKL